MGKKFKDDKYYNNIKAMRKGIKKYKQFRFLWDTTHPKYYCQKWRAAAWEEVIRVWCKYSDETSPKYVKNRISHMRSNYTRLKKKVDSQWLEHGVVYKPQLWYYDLISFVGDPFNTSHATDIDDKKFARALEEKQKRKSRPKVVPAASTSTRSVGANSQDTFRIGNYYTFGQYQQLQPLDTFLPLETFVPLGNYYFVIDTIILPPEPKLEDSSPFLGMKMSENDNQQFHASLSSSYLIGYVKDPEKPKKIFDFSLEKKEYDDILNGLSPTSYE